MIQRVLVLLLTSLLALTLLPAAGQSLRPSTQLGGSASAQPRGSSQPAQTGDYIVAVVNSEPITNFEVRARMVRVEQQMSQQGAAMPPRTELARQVLERLINEKAQLQQAVEDGIKIDTAQIDQAEQNVAQQNQITVAELDRRLTQEGVSLTQFRDDLRNQLLLSRLRDREVEPRVKVSDAEVDQFIRDKQGVSDVATMQINLAQVLVAVPENATPAQVVALAARAQLVLQRAKAGEDFAALVNEFSDAPDHSNGGQLGMRMADRYPPLFVDAVKNLPIGAVAGPIRSGAGFHILKVVEKSQAGLPGVTVTQSHARHILLRPGPQLSESDAIARLADFKKRVESGQADFAALAKQYSQDGSATEGGDLGWVNPGQFVPEFEDAMNGLAPGQLSAPIVSRFGVHLIQLLGRREATLSQTEQREIARNLVRNQKLDEEFTRWAQEIRDRAYVEYRDPPQ